MIEAIVQSVREAISAEELGFDRLELVSAIDKDGLTPKLSVVKSVLENVSLPVQVMVRPHSNRFIYSGKDRLVIKKTIEELLGIGCDRIVFGALDSKRRIDEKLLEEIVTMYSNLDITFHRAFDESADLIESYKTLSQYSNHVNRVLTSGGASTCLEGRYGLKNLVKISKEIQGPVIMAGAGLSEHNLKGIHDFVNAEQYHFGKGVRVDQSYDQDFSLLAVAKIRSILL